jgi:heme-degrading monooxygenase HmoA
VVLVISTFKVANGMEAAVRQAFLDRPRMVDDAPGFIGMEVFVDHRDASLFHLLTRWSDEASFQSWHSGPLHNLSHQGIPKGLKLDPSHTIIRTWDRVSGDTSEAPFRSVDALTAAVPRFLPARFLDHSWAVHWMRVSADGRIAAANPAFESLLQEAAGRLAGRSLWDLLTDPDSASLRAVLEAGSPESKGPWLLNFVDRSHSPHTLECHVESHDQGFVLVGEPVREHDQDLARGLMDLNNQWALLVRENEKNVKALRLAKEQLEKALADLNESHWHLRKIQETLPICMYCGKVKTGEAHWEDVIQYLKANSLFLSHGCCPACAGRMWESESLDRP